MASQSSTNSSINLPNFLLPNFTRSIIKFKSGGDNKTAMLNYNIVDEEMVFMQPDAYMSLDNPEVIDTVYMAGRKFVPVQKAFYEVLANGSTALLIQYKTTAESEGTPTAYGATTKTQGNTYIRQVYGPRGSVDLKMPDDIKLTEANNYWIRTAGTMVKFSNKRQFLKACGSKEKELSQYIDKNSVNFKKQSEVVKLVSYWTDLNK